MNARRPAVGVAGLAGLALALPACVLLALAFGSSAIPLERILGILAHAAGFGSGASSSGGVTWRAWEATAILDVRLPRVLVAALAGGGLAMCGAALQGLFRNPLASPDVLGVTSGAALGAVAAIYFGLGAASVWALPALAALGGGVTIFGVYAVATRRGHASIGTLLLAGVAFTSLNGALISLILSLALADYRIGGQIVYWTLGGLDGRTWDHVGLAAPPVLLGSAVIAAYARDLDALMLGETHAASVGVDVPRARRTLIAVTALVTGALVAVSGAIAFVGLVAPHLLRLALGPAHRRLLPASALGGAVFLVLADLVARSAIPPEEIRLGVITAAVGAPFFLFLLLRRRGEGLW